VSGRFCSIVLDAAPPLLSGDVLRENPCQYEWGCVRRSPAGALTEAGLDQQRCYVHCLENDARFPHWLADICGKCATGPCAVL
jgi:hypothetical protein